MLLSDWSKCALKPSYTEWIKPRGWCHKVVLHREQLNYCKHLQGVEPPLDDVERPSKLTLHSHQAAYKAAKQSGGGKQIKKTKATLLEFLIFHGLEDKYNYIVGGKKGEPLNTSDTVLMEIGVEAEAAASHRGGEAPSGRRHKSWEEQVQMRDDEEQAAKEAPKRRLPPPLPRNTASTSTTALPTDDEGFTMVQGRKSHDKRPRDPSKDLTLRRRPSKASHSPLPFPLRSEAERVAKVHTLFESVTHETRPFSPWVYDRLKDYYPNKTKEQLIYFSNVLCLAISEFHLTCGCTATGMCSPVLPQIVEAELPLLEAYLHKYEVGTQDVCILSEATIKRLGVWLHRIDMTMSKQLGKAKVNSILSKDHRLGDLLDFFLMPDNTNVSMDNIFWQAVVENVDALQVRLVKCKKILKQANKTHGKLLTQRARLKETQERSLPTKAAHVEAKEALHQTADQLERMREIISSHTEEIAHIKKLLKEKESSEDDSSSPEDDPTPGSGLGNPTQQEDIEMEDDKGNSNLPQGMATQTDPPTMEAEEDLGAVGGVDPTTPGEDQITMEGGGTTPITPVNDKLLEEYDDLLDNLNGATTPSGIVTESLSQMNMGCPMHMPPTNDPPSNDQKT